MDELVKYRLESAKERLKSSKLLLKAGQYKNSIAAKKKLNSIMIEDYIQLIFRSRR